VDAEGGAGGTGTDLHQRDGVLPALGDLGLGRRIGGGQTGVQEDGKQGQKGERRGMRRPRKEEKSDRRRNPAINSLKGERPRSRRRRRASRW
jgi:hypothetical protein